jgi:hypothetical protein
VNRRQEEVFVADYAIRVELRGNPTREEYETLHALMSRKGFYQTISGSDAQGNRRGFNLPHAVYYGSSTANCGAVRDSVRDAVKAEVQADIIVLVVEATTWALGW